MPGVVHFEFTAEDPERAVEFYRKVFGWEITRWAGPVEYWMVKTGTEDEPGINGAIVRNDELREPGRTFNTIEVSSVNSYIEKVIAAGGRIIEPKSPVPGVGHVAFCADTEGLMFGIIEID